MPRRISFGRYDANAPIVWLSLTFLILLGGCARVAVQEDGFQNAACSWQWRHLQQRLDAKGIRDAQAVTVSGEPFLRVTRKMASFELDQLDHRQRLDWLELAFQEGRRGLESEVSRLDDAPALEPLMQCARAEIVWIAYDDRRWEKLSDRVSVPDAYQSWRRAVGLFPLMRPLLGIQVRRLEAYFEAQYGSYEGGGEWRRYLLAREVTGGPATESILTQALNRSALGLYHFTEQEQQLLLTRHAPVLEVETSGSYDRPGSPRWQNGRWEVEGPVRAYTQVTETRWQGEWVPQLIYHFWFDERPREHLLDIYGGRLDGFIWRVTLTRSGDVLLYDSVHPCGCYLKWHPVKERLTLKPDAPDDGIMTLMPVSLSGKGSIPPIVRLQSSTHYLVDIAHTTDGKEGGKESYTLAPYDNLRSIHGDRRRSLFDSDGLVPGTERLERFLLWNTGVPSPGAMRQWGQHATSFLGTRHFDDPGLLDRYFMPFSPGQSVNFPD